ncbi:OprD family outer membrane porin [Metapseudomonas resinovorans]|uniref:Putative dipeptide-specific porin OpdP n=1 Tax=Metapseudomonas resinovorans NBRC 106553 TaxID=1245471 RepID=S6ARS6_METRE|nr:OprD family outer membrane porin [Pseudomonas resinovorans]BAN46731.1 putative dipeptide-specific porin OpdP [Pseudomonas resinovorans NBRC 106553]
MNLITRNGTLLGLALLTANATLAAEQAIDQSTARGFVEGQKVDLVTRNFFSHERTQDSFSFTIPKDDGGEPTRDRWTWVQGTRLIYNSGYTEGTVGVGLDLEAIGAVNLERGKGRIAGGGNRTLADSNGHGVAEWSKMGVANLRLRASRSELKAGRFRVDTPVFSYIYNRALPSSFDGVALDSFELDSLSLHAGSFRQVSPRSRAGSEDFTTEYGTREVRSDRMSYVGARHTPVEGLELSLFSARFEDVWNQHFLGATHELGDPEELALRTELRAYSTRDQGARKAGYIDNDSWSLAFNLTHRAHSLTLGWQRVHGDEFFDYVNETDAIHLGNSRYSDYNGPNERSALFSYDFDWSQYGVPGVSTGYWYVKGWGIDGTRYRGDRNGAYGNYAEVRAMDGERHREYGLSLNYKVPGGNLEGSTVRVLYMEHKASKQQVDGSTNELRIVSTFPFNLL